MGDIMTTTFIRKIMKGKKIMQKETKKERFDRISEARKLKYLTEFACLKTAQTNQITNTQMMK